MNTLEPLKSGQWLFQLACVADIISLISSPILAFLKFESSEKASVIKIA